MRAKGGITLKIAICDDNQDFDYNGRLNKLLDNYMINNQIFDYEIKLYTSGLDLTKEYSHGLYDFIFLDVDMPKFDGFETAEHIRKRDRYVYIVFVTNMADQVYNSFQYGAKDYLCKPASQSRIDKLMDRLISERNYQEKDNLYDIKLKFGGTTPLYLPDVLYFESDNQYVVAVTTGEEFTFVENLANVSECLESKGFIRIHRRRLVNKIHVFQVFGDYLVLKTGEEFTVGKRYKATLAKALKGVW